MRRELSRYKSFTRRTIVLATGKTLLLSAIIARMYQLQVLESDRYALLADENRINLRLLPPPRGRIVDRFGRPLAINRQNYRVALVGERAGDAEATLAALSSIIELDDGERARILDEVGRKRSFVPITVRENITWQDVARIEVNTPDLPGLSIEAGQSRYYPHGEVMAHVLGYVAPVSKKELTGDPLLELPDFRIGKGGVEKYWDRALRGSAGTSQLVVNAVGRVIEELSRDEGRAGAKITLSVDLDRQKFVRKRLGDESAAAVLLEVDTGAVLAMASTPSFDPNRFNAGMSANAWEALVADKRAPLVNKAIAGQYPPGSAFKMIVALAALENDVVTSRHTFHCTGRYDLGDSRFHCWRKAGHGTLDMRAAIVQSCDVYFYEIARRVGIERIAAMARRFGLGRRLEIDLPGEASGVIPDPDWKQAELDEPWQQGETLITAIGQGFVLTTPLQLAVMMARLVNGGHFVKPRIRTARSDSQQSDTPDSASPVTIGVSGASLAFIRTAMDRVVNSPLGTAYKGRIEATGLEMGGKTGTVQVRRISESERKQGLRRNEDLPWEQRDHAVFVAMRP